MSVVKEAAIRVIESLPESCSTHDILQHLYLSERLALAREDVAAGRVYSEEEVDKWMEEWLESSGPKQS